MKRKLLFSMTALILCSSVNLSAKDNDSQYLLKRKKPFVISSLKETTSEDGIKDKIMITAGAGLNVLGKLIEARYYLNDYYTFDGNISSSTSSPMFNVAGDYGLGKKFSIGVAFGYQTAKINITNVLTTGDHYYDSWKRTHFAVRGDYYIIAKEKINLYTGLKLGYNVYSVTTNMPANYFPGYLTHLNVTPNPVSVQAHFGFRYYFTEMIGFNTEVGLGFGGPYLFAAGLAIQL
jgi:hypothetical protein